MNIIHTLKVYLTKTFICLILYCHFCAQPNLPFRAFEGGTKLQIEQYTYQNLVHNEFETIIITSELDFAEIFDEVITDPLVVRLLSVIEEDQTPKEHFDLQHFSRVECQQNQWS
jgi:hypothetical protein